MFGPPLGGRYVVRRELGRGATGRVFMAEDLHTGGSVAIKVLDDEAAGSVEAVLRLQREGAVAALIHHPNVCSVSDIGTRDNGAPFLVLEHLDGETLAERLERETRLPVPVAVGFLEQILLGLHAAHRLGIVHRDLKPPNMFLVDLGLGRRLLKLLDFGIAFAKGIATTEDPHLTLTRAGRVVGTPEYMSPEQVRGLRDFDARTDIYACGVVAYEMLAGRRPFHGVPAEELGQMIGFKQAPPLAQLAPHVPPPIARAIDQALAVSAGRRHVDAAAFLAALGRDGVAEALPTVGASGVERAEDWEVQTREDGRPTDWDVATHESGPPSVIERMRR